MSDSLDLSVRRANLSLTQRAMLQARLRGGHMTNAAQSITPRQPRSDRAPLSYAQQRQWFLWQMNPESTAYHMCGGLALTGHLDVDAIRASLDALVARHDSYGQLSVRTAKVSPSRSSTLVWIFVCPTSIYRT